MRVDTVTDGAQVTVFSDLDDERAFRLASILDQLCDSRTPTVLDLRKTHTMATTEWLVIERCRRRFAHASIALRLITNPDGYTKERREAVSWLEALSSEPGEPRA